MKIYAISDLHLSTITNKPMDIFGDNWQDYLKKIEENWQANISCEDVVLICGDISWGININEALPDFDFIDKLNGTKILIKGNHDYWWGSYSKVTNALPSSIKALQNNCVRVNSLLACGTRGWQIATENSDQQDKTLYAREVGRLKLTLETMQAHRKDDDFVVVMMHYPPFDASFADSQFTNLISQFKPNLVVYGHLHGKDCRSKLVVNKNGINYFLTSCDKINHNPVLLGEI